MVAVLLKKTEVRNYKIYFLILGLVFADISNIFYWGIIPLPELFDLFLLLSLVLVILEVLEIIYPYPFLAHLLFLASFNNFLVTYFFFVWGFLEPEKDLCFMKLFGLPAETQIFLDSLSLYSLVYTCKKYKRIIGKGKKISFNVKIILMEILLMFTVYFIWLFISLSLSKTQALNVYKY